MPTFQISANILVPAAILGALAFISFISKTRQIAKSRSYIFKLEEEIKRSQAEFLGLQQDFVALDIKAHKKDPLVAMKNILNPEADAILPDISIRKKLLSKEKSPEKADTLSIVYSSKLSREA
jgi:hypothetical protein